MTYNRCIRQYKDMSERQHLSFTVYNRCFRQCSERQHLSFTVCYSSGRTYLLYISVVISISCYYHYFCSYFIIHDYIMICHVGRVNCNLPQSSYGVISHGCHSCLIRAMRISFRFGNQDLAAIVTTLICHHRLSLSLCFTYAYESYV